MVPLPKEAKNSIIDPRSQITMAETIPPELLADKTRIQKGCDLSMWNIIEFNQIARGEQVRLFTACGMFEGIYRGSECVSEEDDTQWIILSDATLSPCRANAAPEERIPIQETNIQLSQIIAIDTVGE